MPPGFKDVHGFLWPAEDQDCAGAIFKSLDDLEIAMGKCRAFAVAIQAGGNAGVWPKMMGQKFQTVYTFEPEPRNFHCLAHNCRDSNIVKFKAALGNYAKAVGLAYEHGPRNMGAVFVSGEGSIPVLRVDDLGLFACDFIQLDLEGYEFEALRGAETTIKKYGPVIMIEEKHQCWPGRYPWGSGACEAYLATLGYVVRRQLNRDLILTREA